MLSGAYSEVDFASFVAWRDWDFPDKSVRNCFAMAALRSADGAFLLGEMGAHTATAGQIYFAAGTPDRNDLVGDTVDLERGVMRELAEETGLTLADVVPEPGWTAVLHGQRTALMKIVEARDERRRIGRAHPGVSLKSNAAGARGRSHRANVERSAAVDAGVCDGVSRKPLALGLARRSPVA